jgi:hypothetical protein
LVHKKIALLLFHTIPGVIILGIVLVGLGFCLPALSGAAQQAQGYSIQFFGNGQGDIDRIKIPLQPQKPVNIGSTDFTIEWWMKANPGDNASAAYCDQNDGWIYGNILFDRDVWGAGDDGDYGIALNAGAIAFGVNDGAQGTTLCGMRDVTDGRWHHVAVTRQAGSGTLMIFVDGVLDQVGESPAGDISYREGRSTPYEDDPFLVIGAEKHDAGSDYPSFKGWVDEVRVSNLVRYRESFTPQTGPFTPDEATMTLLHFDEGPAGRCSGEILDSTEKNTAFCQFGGSAEQGPLYSDDHPFMQIAPASETTAPTQAAQPATGTPFVVGTSTALPTLTHTPADAENNLPTSTTDLEKKATSTTAVEAPLEQAEPANKNIYLFASLAVLIVGAVVILILARKKK